MNNRGDLPPWPATHPEQGPIRLRRFTDADAAMAMALSRDPYVPTVGSLPANATLEEALAWIARQRQRFTEGSGFSFSIAELPSDRAVGNIGLWTRDLGQGRAQAGYAVVPSARGAGIAAAALGALTTFAWSIDQLHRVELYIEPWNVGSMRTAERCGYRREGLLRSHQEIAGKRCDMVLYAATRDDIVRPPTDRGGATNAQQIVR